MTTNVIHNVHIADGFTDDCDELIHRCTLVDKLSFQTFCEIWKDMQFASIFFGRTSGSELAELSEEVVHIAKGYMVANTGNFEETVAGVFLLYSVLHTQPYRGFASVRLVPADMPAVGRIAAVARRERRYDVLYILGSILVRGPCQFHAEQRERGMEAPIKKYLEGFSGIDETGVRPKGVFYRQNEELDIIREVHAVTRRYTEVKAKIVGKGVDPSLCYVDGAFTAELASSLKSVITGIADTQGTAGTSSSQPTVEDIKRRAMRGPVAARGTVPTSAPAPSTTKSSPNKKDLKSSPGKIKTGNRGKPVSGSPKKRPTKTTKKKCNNSSSNDKKEDSASIDSFGDELDIAAFGKDQSLDEAPDSDESSQTLNLDTLPSQDKIVSQPGLIVEIIDNMQKTEPTSSSNKKSGQKRKNTSSNKRKAKEARRKSPRSSQNKKDEVVFKKPREVTEKRYLKNVLLKSKLKRLGYDGYFECNNSDSTSESNH